MENKVELFNNEKLKMKVRAIKNGDGSISVNVEDVILGLGFIKIDKKNGKEYTRLDIPRVKTYIDEFGFGNYFPNFGKDDYIPESVFYMLSMKAKNDVAKEFQKWLAVDVIPTIRNTGRYIERTNSNLFQTSEVNNLIDKLDKKTSDLGQYYKPSHKKKLDINKYIKQCLGTNASKDNCDRVKDMLLVQLGFSIYDEVPIDILHSSETAKKIFDICYMISCNDGQVQMDLDM